MIRLPQVAGTLWAFHTVGLLVLRTSDAQLGESYPPNGLAKSLSGSPITRELGEALLN